MSEKKIYKYLIPAICIMMVISLAISGVTLVNSLKTSKAVNGYFGGTEDPAQEDDVVIASEYRIMSTLKISDAYKSGDTSALSDADKETLDMAKKVIDENITEGMSDYEKEEAIYLWLTTKLKSTAGILTVIPDVDSENYTPHDVLKNHSAVCVGYATTFRLFMQMLGIECKVVHDTDLTHSWDLVKLDDGWYHTDCYTDADGVKYSNFNMNDTMCNVSHTWNRSFFPKAEGTKYNYALMVKKELKNIYALPQWLTDNINEKKTVCTASFKADLTSEKAQNAALYMCDSLQTMLSGDDYDVTYQWLTDDEGKYVVVFLITYYNNSPETNIDDETRDKIDNAISDVLGGDYEDDDYSDYSDDDTEVVVYRG